MAIVKLKKRVLQTKISLPNIIIPAKGIASHGIPDLLRSVYFEQLFLQSPDAIAALDTHEIVIHVNPTFTKMFGYTQDGTKGRHINNLIVPSNLKKEATGLSDKTTCGKKVYLETVRQHKDGRLIHVSVTGMPVFIPGGRQIGIYAIYHDLTDQKKAQEALAQSEQRYALAVRGTNDGLWDWDMLADKKYYSPRFKELLGYKDSEITDTEVQEIFPTMLLPGEWGRLTRVRKAHFLHKVPYDIEYQIKTKSGEIRWFRSRAQAVWNDKGWPIRIAGSIRDITRRKLAETALAASQKLLHDILQGSPVPTYVIDLNHKIIVWNKAMERLTGCKADEMVGTDKHWEIFYPEKRFMIADYMVEGLSPEEIIKKHYSLTNFRESLFENGVIGDAYFPNFFGGGKWMRFMIKPLYDPSGNQIGAIEMAQDIHEQKIAEQELHERLEELKVLHQAHAHISINYPLGELLHNVVKDLFLLLRSPDIAHSRIIFDDRDYRARCERSCPKLIAKIEEPLILNGKKRGKITLGYSKKIPGLVSQLFSPKNKELLKTIANVLSRHLLSRETFERHMKLLQKLNMGVFIVEGNIFRYANPKLCNILRAAQKQVIGRHFNDFVLNLALYSHGKIPSQADAKAMRQDGELIDVEVFLQNIDYHGRQGVLGTLQDVTSFKQAQGKMRNFNRELQVKIKEKTRYLEIANKRLLSLNELKDEFISVTSHELRSPLTAARGYLSFLNDQAVLESLPESIRQYVTRAYSNVEALNNLVNNILDVSRIDSGRFSIKKIQANIVSIIKNILDNFSLQLREKHLRISFKNLTRMPQLVIPVDTIRFHQVMVNLLDNAIKYSKEGRNIFVILKKETPWAVIQIQDKGIGIPKKDLPSIFDKFVQSKNAASSYKGGAGLGLFIIRKIVELHGGNIEVKSCINKGACFTIRLPIA